MSMQYMYTVRDTHSRPITAFGRNPHRREILLGFEDGVIKTYDCESGFLVQKTHQHEGFITDFAYWWSPKFLFSCSNDGSLVVWASGGGLYSKHKFPIPIYSMALNESKNQLILGFKARIMAFQLDENGVIKTYDCESGFLVQKTHQHEGFITDFAYWWSPKFLFSCSNDGSLVVWASGGGLYSKHKFPIPIYSMALNESKNQLILGFKARIMAFQLDEKKVSGNVLRLDSKFELNDPELYHHDIVRRMLLHENRLFTAGYDQKLILFEVSAVSFGNRKVLHRTRIIKKAHATAIICMVLNDQSSNNQWLATGAFDKSLKLWTLDGDPTFRIDDFQGGNLTSFCYITHTRTLWVACGLNTPLIYDPKSGDNVTDYVEVDYKSDYPNQKLTKLDFFPKMNVAVASNVRRHLIVWKFNPNGCVGLLKNNSPVLSLSYTRKEPILLFSGALDGQVKKWERSQANMFTYSQDLFSPKDANRRLMEAQSKFNAKMGLAKGGGSSQSPLVTQTGGSRRSKQGVKEEDGDSEGEGGGGKRSLVVKRQKRITSAYAGLNVPLERSVKIHRHNPVGHLKQIYVEDLDIILSSCEDGNIYIWGFDKKAVKKLKRVQSTQSTPAEDAITNRVAGFSCRNVLIAHHGPVTSLILITGFQHIYLLSAGWDRRILIWNLDSQRYADSCQMGPVIESKDPKEVKAAMEVAADGAILDMVYSPERNEFAYGCADRLVYVRKFSPSGSEMFLVNTLLGHLGEVNCVGWISDLDSWVSAADDSTMRVWSSVDAMECTEAISLPGPASALTVDNMNRVLVVAAQNSILVYDIFSWRILQSHCSFNNSIINCLLLLPERNQYLSGSSDGTIQLWSSSRLNALINNLGKVTARQLEQQKVANILHGPPDSTYSNQGNKSLNESDFTVYDEPISRPQLSREISRMSLLSLTTRSRRYSADSGT
ncbi:uncharacterized protein LOC134841831 [Symsagittifera roscoffensis]|uniref:uncharacterized protein LOC134841831 n=1 Tax=Symsagittifera roscoffensis TaxID=84072 RepID=UPI00307C866A